jgi:lysozyme
MAKISDFLLQELKRHEGVRTQVYDDLSGKPVGSYAEVKGAPTIAMGKKIQEHERDSFRNFFKGKSELKGSDLDKVIRDTVEPREKKLAGLIKVPVTQSMFDAVFSFAYNTGFGASSFKKVLEKLNAGDYTGAKAAIATGPQSSKGKQLPGLVKRRAFEAEHFMKEGLPEGTAMAGLGVYGDALGVSTISSTDYGETYQVSTPYGSASTFAKKSAVFIPVLTTVNGALSWGVLGAGIGAVLPNSTWKSGAKTGAKWGAIVGCLGGIVYAGLVYVVASAGDDKK